MGSKKGVGSAIPTRLSTTTKEPVSDEISTYTSNEYDSFQTLSQDGDEWQHEQSPFTTLTFCLSLSGLTVTLFECDSELVSPFDPRSIHFEECDAHDENQDGGDCGKDAFPNLFCLGP